MKAVWHHVVFLFVNITTLVDVILKWTFVGDMTAVSMTSVEDILR